MCNFAVIGWNYNTSKNSSVTRAQNIVWRQINWFIFVFLRPIYDLTEK
jgi:hypothetical protein